MPFELVHQRQLAPFNPVLHFKCACAVAANAINLLAHFPKKLVIFVFRFGEFSSRLRACAVENNLHFAAGALILSATSAEFTLLRER